MVLDQSGNLAGVSRHDYLPFGEELFTSNRDGSNGYTVDGTRQKFTGYEADDETGLNFAQARYQSNVQGRFTSVDPLMASADVTSPQSLNRYSYVENNPVNLVDPLGLTYLVDGSASMGDGLALNLLRSGAGILGPLQTTRWNPNSGGLDVGGFETFRAVGNYAGWFDMHGISIGIQATLSLDGYGSWDAGFAYYGATGALSFTPTGGTRFGATGGGEDSKGPLDPPSRPGGYVDFNGSWGTHLWVGPTAGAMVDTKGTVAPYFGLGIMTPGPSGTTHFSTGEISGGLNVQIQGSIFLSGAVGWDEAGNSFQEGGGGTPGFSLTVFYVLNAPHPYEPSRRHRMNAAINGDGPVRNSGKNCSCNSR